MGVAATISIAKTPPQAKQREWVVPIYEYHCGACGHQFDALQKLSEPPLQACPDCSAPELKKLVSAPSFRLKGSGWYETDFKKDNKRNLVDGEKPKSEKQKSDDKPAAKSESKKSDKKKGGSTEAA